MKIILDLCGGTGAWSKPYKENGYDVRVLTLPDFDVTKWREYDWLVELIEKNKVYGILAAPPCTMFSIARNDTTAKEPRDLREGMRIVQSCLDMLYHLVNWYEKEVDKNALQKLIFLSQRNQDNFYK